MRRLSKKLASKRLEDEAIVLPSFQAVLLGKDDVLVFTFDRRVSLNMLNRLKEQVAQMFGPDQKMMVLDAGVTLSVINREQDKAAKLADL